MAMPDIAALMGGAGAGAANQFPPHIQIGAAAGGAPAAGPESQPVDLLKQMIDLAKQYLEVEPDEEDKATMAKTLATLQSYLAKDQADQDAALGNKSTARLLRKAG